MGALRTCNDCRSYHALKDKAGALLINNGKAQGECHRFPPSVNYIHSPHGLQIRTQNPIVNSDQWCDEFLRLSTVQE